MVEKKKRVAAPPTSATFPTLAPLETIEGLSRIIARDFRNVFRVCIEGFSERVPSFEFLREGYSRIDTNKLYYESFIIRLFLGILFLRVAF